MRSPTLPPPLKPLLGQILSLRPSKRQVQAYLDRWHAEGRAGGQQQSLPPTRLPRLAILRVPWSMAGPSASPSTTSSSISPILKAAVQLNDMGLWPVLLLDPPPLPPPPTSSPALALSRPWSVLAHTRLACFRAVTGIEAHGGRALPILGGLGRAWEEVEALREDPNAPEQEAEGPPPLLVASLRAAHQLGSIPVLSPAIFLPPARSAFPGAQVGLPNPVLNPLALLLPLLRRVVGTEPEKIASFTPEGGVYGPEGRHEVLLNLAAQLEDRCGQPASPVKREDVRQLMEAVSLLPPTASGVLLAPCHAESLVANLIADRPVHVYAPAAPSARRLPADRQADDAQGAGASPTPPFLPPTTVRRGCALHVHTSLADVDRTELQALLERSFGRPVRLAFWSRLEHRLAYLVVAGAYEGCVLLTRESSSLNGSGPTFMYLDKFAVCPHHQGTGTADILWSTLRTLCPDVCWRSRQDNPVNKWYFDRSDGNLKLEGSHWMLFWCGYDGAGDEAGNQRSAGKEEESPSRPLLACMRAVGLGIEPSFEAALVEQ